MLQKKTFVANDNLGDKEKKNICITSLTDEQSPSHWQRLIRCRDFDDVSGITFNITARYSNKHNYRFYDLSHLIDPSRPPAWSKILAVQYLLRLTTTATNEEEQKATITNNGTAGSTTTARQQADVHTNSNDNHRVCDWVLWLDADVLIMNSSVPLEAFLPADDVEVDVDAHGDNNDDHKIHLVVTHDKKFVANSGAWLIRNDPWSYSFLQRWWDMKTWVRRSGFSLSGDNAAFGHLVQNELLQMRTATTTESSGDSSGRTGRRVPEQQQPKIAMPARCNFNSFGVYMTQNQYDQLLLDNDNSGAAKEGGDSDFLLKQQEWYQQPDQFYYEVRL